MPTEILPYTPVESIPGKVQALQTSFHQGKTQLVSYRLDQLRNIYFMIKDNEQEIKNALKLDLNKPENESQLTEISVVLGDLLYIIDNLEKWVKPECPADVPLLFKLASPKVYKQAFGTVLIISPFNYPFILSIQPLIGAIPGGNTVLYKPSELTPHTSALLTRLLSDTLDSDTFAVVNGAVRETSALLDQKFDMIFYTGSGAVGKIIAKKAAENLTPCILELGGKSPVFIGEGLSSYELNLSAKRILHGKFTNAGQTCVAPDYVLVHESHYDEFTALLLKNVQKLYGSVDSESYSKIVHERSFDRLTDIVTRTSGEIIHSGDNSREHRFFSPTIIKDVTFEDSTMKDEMFGPVLPIIKYSSLSSAIDNVVRYHDTPLALYIFSQDQRERDIISTRIRSGAVLFNETLIHVGISQLPFGGIGQSGYGDYHGKNSFEAFTQNRASLTQPFWAEPLFDVKYPPVTNFDLKLASTFTIPFVSLNRTGPVFSRSFKVLRFGVLFLVAFMGLSLGFLSDGRSLADIIIRRVENIVAAAFGAEVYW
ncbi:hypothetical protein WICPIJ_008107 [Wickerhamomyces pijperi]|uniref:Aldehyde dehydrogenase n=1 Tax=Wickerhamomyces pijperi TaxID=599730 RepID=A0A9P8TJ78_WICPI|nr:hypothetical protein WICPIJ_008107 [Wickerhamomyces pijperi]